MAAIAGIAFQFYGGGPYPAAYDGALFFADYTRDCIWALKRSGGTLPSPSNIETFVAGASTPVDLQRGPGGDLFYVDIAGGTVRRISYSPGNQPPVAKAEADPDRGEPPLTVNFDASESIDPNPGDTVSFAWDLDGDGAYDDSTAARPSFTYSTRPGTPRGRSRATTTARSADLLDVSVGPPTVRISRQLPVRDVGGRRHDQLRRLRERRSRRRATGVGARLGADPAPLSERLPRTFPTVLRGRGRRPLPGSDHDYPAFLEVRLTATDLQGLTSTDSLQQLSRKTGSVEARVEPDGRVAGRQ